MTSCQVQDMAHACGFEIAGVTAATPHADFARFTSWSESGKAGSMRYLTDQRAALRATPASVLPNARSIICLGKLYNTDRPFSTENTNPDQGWISRYAWGSDYHNVLRPPLKDLTTRLTQLHGAPFDSRISIDTAPLLERSYARAAGLGWIGKNTCLINQHYGSWFFLAELLVDLEISPDSPVPDRCGNCTRCIDACPTTAIIPHPQGGFELDARLCISYLTIEERAEIPPDLALHQGQHIFGCDICQDVCPWNLKSRRHKTDISTESSFAARIFAPDLAALSSLTEEEFRLHFHKTPIFRAKYEGFLRNVAIAMGNSQNARLTEPLTRLTQHRSALVSQTARQALQNLTNPGKAPTSDSNKY